MNANSYMSGWCTTCGRRRGSDGRCVNCDPWWTSPLIQVGGPALAITCVFLVGLVAAVTPPKADPSAVSSESGRSSAPALFTPPAAPTYITPTGPLTAPTFAAAPPPLATIPQLPPEFFQPTPPPDAQQMAEFEQLRYQVRLASIEMRARSDGQRPFASAPSAPAPFYPLKRGFGSPQRSLGPSL